ncbi:MAG: YggS family pyridoxal phosphate-dependent enzyme [Christensenella sp.]|nr:YggS family pyridoxal phosphate-dependent enzyme [Christensenella sp.]
MSLQENIESVQERIAQYEAKAGVPENSVQLVAVSKTVDTQTVREAYDLGLRMFGENRVQEFLRKSEELPKDIDWNLIGQLQTNKVKYIINNKIALLHSLDRLSLAQELQTECVKKDASIETLVQVNIAKEDTKSGLYIEDVEAFFEEIKDFDRIHVRGFMTIAPFTDDRVYLRKVFAAAKKLYDLWKPSFERFDTLSMGMSGDYGEAILEGANMVRVGSAIFGARHYQ